VRGRSQPDSDYDVAVFLRDLRDRETEMNRLADIATEIVYNDGEFVRSMPITQVLTMSRPPSCRKSALRVSTCEAAELRVS